MLDPKPRLTYYPNQLRAQITVIALGVCALISVMTIVHSFTAIDIFRRLDRGDFALAEITALDERLRTLALFEVGAYLMTAILFLFWIHRAYKNHEQLSRRGNEYSPGWAVFGFFIPIVSLFRPYQVVREMWDETQAGTEGDPLLATPAHSVIILWWLAFLAMSFISRLSSTATADSAAELTTAMVIDIVVQVTTIVSAVLAIRIIQTIHLHHETRRLQAQPVDTPADRPGWSSIVYAWSIGVSVIILGVVLFGSGSVATTIDQLIASAPTAVPARKAAVSPSGQSKPTAIPTTPSGRNKSTATPGKRPRAVRKRRAR